MARFDLVKSPCINICTLDNKSNLCIGCLRTSAEIANWVYLSVSEKNEVILEIKSRRSFLDFKENDYPKAL